MFYEYYHIKSSLFVHNNINNTLDYYEKNPKKAGEYFSTCLITVFITDEVYCHQQFYFL